MDAPEMVAARRLTRPRACTPAMTPNARIATARNTVRPSMATVVSPEKNRLPSASMSDLEVDHAVHDHVADQHPAGGCGETDLGEVVLPHAAVEVRRDELDDDEDQDRQRRENHRRGAAFRGERLDLAPH